MKYLSSNSVFIFTVAFFLLNLCGCKTIYNSEFVQPPVQPVSGPIEIGPEWVEIIPPKPLIPYGKYQNIHILNSDFNHNNLNEYYIDRNLLNLADGRKTKIEAVLYDDVGEIYKLGISGRTIIRTEDDKIVPSGIEFSRYLITETINGREEQNIPDFPADRTYTKLKIRSEINLKCQNIEWVGRNPSLIR